MREVLAMHKTWHLFLLLILFLSGRALANDTLGMVKGGNLVPKKTEDVSMVSESLFVSKEKIRVEYEFRNNSDKPVEGIVLFPLMEFFSVQPYPFDTREFEKNKDPLGFSVKAGGAVIPVRIDKKKICIDKKNDVYQLNVQYYWNYTFPPQQSVRVEHSYLPVAGSGGLSEEDKRNYCIDSAFEKDFKNLSAKLGRNIGENENLLEYMHYHSFAHIGYILKTAKNWAGPIQNFKLVIEKPSPGSLVSTCWKGLKKINKTQFEFERKNFIPSQDLNVLFVDDAVEDVPR